MVRDLREVVQVLRKCQVKNITKFSKSSMNHVFKVETDREAIVARVFAKKDFPDCKKLLWIHEVLQGQGIDTPKILYCTKSTKPFRYGFMLVEYIEGVSGWQAMREGRISLDDYFVKLGEILRRVHTIKVTNSAPIRATHPKGQYRWFKKVVADLASKSDLPHETMTRIQDFVIETLTSFLPRFKSVLCHCDVGPQNHIYTPEGKIVLLDWDLAEVGNLFRDFSVILMDGKEMTHFGKMEEVSISIQKAFLRGYGETAFTEEETQKIIDAHHMISLVYNTLAYVEGEKNSVQEKKNKVLMMKILERYS